MEKLIHDLRFGLRALWRDPGFTLIATLMLALGIGSSVAMLGIASAVLWRPLPFPEADGLVFIDQRGIGEQEPGPMSMPTFEDLRQRNRSFESLGVFKACDQTLNGLGDSADNIRVKCTLMSVDLLEALAIQAFQGRRFNSQDGAADAERTVMVSESLWQQEFGSDAAILGRALRVDGQRYTVIGMYSSAVATESLDGENPIGDLLFPIQLFAAQIPIHERSQRVGLTAVGRLKSGVKLKTCKADVQRITEDLRKDHPVTYDASVLHVTGFRKHVVGDHQQYMLLLGAAVFLVLLIICFNLINLMLTRLARRQHELAIRNALGASRWRLVRQLWAESLLLAFSSAVIGLLLAYLLHPLWPRFLASVLGTGALQEGGRLSSSWIALAASLALGVSLLVGLMPALRATRSLRQKDLGRLRGQKQSSNRFLRQALVTVELTLALLSVIAAGLLFGSLKQLQDQKVGFQPTRVLTLNITLPQATFEDRVAWSNFFRNLVVDVGGLAQVESASLTSLRPMTGEFPSTIIAAGDRALPKPGAYPVTSYQMVGSDYFQTIGVRMVKGRALRPLTEDRADTEPVVVISQMAADYFWPNEDPLGKTLAFEFEGTQQAPIPHTWRRVVGIVEDVRLKNLKTGLIMAVYTPFTQIPHWFLGEKSPTMSLMVKGQAGTGDLLEPIHDLVSEMAPGQRVESVLTLEEILSRQLDKPRDVSSMFAVYALLALLLALIGVYGLITYLVAADTRAIGTRMAIGANHQQILWFFLQKTLHSAVIAIVLSLLALPLLERLMKSLLFGTTSLQPFIFVAGSVLLVSVALFATLIPALRAIRVSPAKALHYE